MAKAPFAAWWGPIPTTNYRVGRTTPLNGGMVVHHVDGSLASADGEFKRYGSQKSAHYGVDFDGSVVCWVDPDDTAYAACASNWQGYIEVECASDSNDDNAPPTAAQIVSLGQIAQFHGIPGHPVETMGGPGIGYHRQFPGDCNTHWGQTDCPGDGFVAAIPAICAAASPAPPPVPSIPGASDVLPILVLSHPHDAGLWLPFAKGYRKAPSVNILPPGTPVITVNGQQWDSGLGDAAKGLA